MLTVQVLVVTPAPTYHPGKLPGVSELLEAVRASQSVLPPRPFVSVTATEPPGDAVVLLTARVGTGAVAGCEAVGGAVWVFGAVTLRLTLFDVHTPLVQDA